MHWGRFADRCDVLRHQAGVQVARQHAAAVANLAAAQALCVKCAACARGPAPDPAVRHAHVDACARTQLKAAAGDRHVASRGGPDREVAGVGEGEDAAPAAPASGTAHRQRRSAQAAPQQRWTPNGQPYRPSPWWPRSVRVEAPSDTGGRLEVVLPPSSGTPLAHPASAAAAKSLAQNWGASNEQALPATAVLALST